MEEILKQCIENNEMVIQMINNPNFSRTEIINYIKDYNQGFSKMVEIVKK